MKYLILSDIHGSLPALEQVLRFYEAEGYDSLLLLGDLLNYGPRNGLPAGLDAPGVAARLNALAARTVAVRGNCDSEVDQMLLSFPMMGDYALLDAGGRRLFLTHGHVYGEDRLPALGCDVLLCGHTHLWKLEPAADGRPAVCNIGSPTFPKGGNPPTFATLDDGCLRVRRIDGTTLAELRL